MSLTFGECFSEQTIHSFACFHVEALVRHACASVDVIHFLSQICVKFSLFFFFVLKLMNGNCWETLTWMHHWNVWWLLIVHLVAGFNGRIHHGSLRRRRHGVSIWIMGWLHVLTGIISHRMMRWMWIYVVHHAILVHYSKHIQGNK